MSSKVCTSPIVTGGLDLGSGIMKGIMIKLEYKITYQIGADIPINPSWIGDQIQASVKKLQAKINKKNLAGQHILKLQLPDGWKLQASSSKLDSD